MERADQEGFPPERYEPQYLRTLLQPADAEDEPFLGWSSAQIAQVDIALSRAFFRYAADNLWGQERSWRSRRDWHRIPREIEPVSLLALALELDALPSALKELPNRQQGYVRLRQSLQRYRQLAALGGWRKIDAGPILHPGESDIRVSVLGQRLRLEGDLREGMEVGDLYSFEIQQGVQRFQQRHGLTADGTLGPLTLQALNVPVEHRINQILRNMERWRWEKGPSEGAEVKINLADYSLEVIDGEKTLLNMPVIIGRQERATPLFVSQIESLIFSPYWYVPPTLLRETMPRVAVDPQYLKRNHYEVLDSEGIFQEIAPEYQRKWQQGVIDASLRQQPGPWNPMGEIKFLLPNSWSIYLHDTPKKSLFSRTQRAFSSGCIRLSQPHKLAHWLLESGHWDSAAVDAMIASSRSRMVELEQPVDLSIGYWTAWVDDAGRLHFRDDVYGRDQQLARELRQEPPLSTSLQ